MKTLWNKLITNESGLILSAELVLILTIGVIGMVTGLACVQQAVVYELNDLGLAFSTKPTGRPAIAVAGNASAEATNRSSRDRVSSTSTTVALAYRECPWHR